MQYFIDFSLLISYRVYSGKYVKAWTGGKKKNLCNQVKTCSQNQMDFSQTKKKLKVYKTKKNFKSIVKFVLN